MSDYRKIYENLTGVKLDFNWSVHHLDLNHFNDDPKNLLAVPSNLHIRYHYHLNRLKEFNLITTVGPTYEFMEYTIENNNTYIQLLKTVTDIMKEFKEYIFLKQSQIMQNGGQ